MKVSPASILRHAGAFVMAAVVLIPLLMTVYGGLKTNGELLASPLAPPEQWMVSNHTEILSRSGFWRAAGNSLLVTALTALGVVGFSALAAFVFARVPFPGRELIYNYFSLGLMFPIAVAILPLYITLRQASLVDTLQGVILTQVAFGLPGNILTLRSFFNAVPGELEDAALIDGCGSFAFFWRILLPLARPALAAAAVITMVGSWNAFFLPLMVLNTEALWTLPLGVMQFQGQYGTDWARVLAYVSLALVPTVVFYLLAERHIITGLTAGAIKG